MSLVNAAPEIQLSEVARAMASAMESAEVRSSVLQAMRASPRVDHSLILGEYLSEARAQDLLAASASALNLSAGHFLSIVQGLPELEFVVPFTEHRLAWTGSSGIALGAYWDTDPPDFRVYEPSGVFRHITGADDLRRYDASASQRFEALFVVRPRETTGTRIGRQADVPGQVIQDPDDGEDAIVVSFRVGDRDPISFDIGQFRNVSEARQAIARGMARELQFSAAERSDTYADGHVTCQENPNDPECVDCNENPWHPICPPRPPGGGSYAVGNAPTILAALELLRNLDPTGDCEIRMTLSYMAGPDDPRSFVILYEDVEVGEPMYPDSLFLHAHPIHGGAIFTLSVVEEDRFSPDDDLGSNQVAWDENGHWQEFNENNDAEADLVIQLVW